MHSLDVAAVGRALAGVRPRVFATMADRLGWTSEDLRELWTFLLGLHDIGKFSLQFQAKAPHAWPAETLGPYDQAHIPGGDPGHSAAGVALLFARRARGPDRARPHLEAWLPGWEDATRSILLAPILAHHGRPAAEPRKPLRDIFSPLAEAAALSFADAVRELLRPPTLREPGATGLRRATWPLAGLTVIADWVGSNTAWFPYRANDRRLESYWIEVALPCAREALAAAGLAPSPPSRAMGFRALTGIEREPSPVQAWAEAVALPSGPLLVLIEDMTGGGKTEAALVLAHRLMAAGRADGIYFALPTMATANAMFDRIREAAPRLYSHGAKPSLTLAHGRADLHPAFRPTVVAAAEAPPENGPAAEDEGADAAVAAPEWLLSETRKALLADLGVGTVDQALLAVLPVRYQALRLAGLAEKVLIVDEAHAYDTYVSAELERLVAFQAMLGGSTIVLSATLPKGHKEKLAAAWSKGARAASPAFAGDAYPSVTLLAPGTAAVAQKQDPREELRRTLRVTRVSDAEAAVARIAEAARTGAAVAWVRNTVDDVIAGAEALGRAGIDAQVFHARFAMGDRLAIERDVVCRFGRKGGGEQRRGRVLVGSQVIESSLDIDLDLMISDLAPVDLLLQRAGRLWRHPGRHRPVGGPEMVVVSPDPNGEVSANWFADAFPRATKVYPHPLILWRSARELFRRGAVRIPEEVRSLIEAVYGPGLHEGAPEALTRGSNEAEGEASGRRAFAEHNLLRIEDGYAPEGRAWSNEGDVATRLGEEMRRVRLARIEAGGLRPWRDGPDLKVAWALSEVTVREKKLRGAREPTPALAAACHAARASWGRFEEDVILLPLELGADGAWTGTLFGEKGRVEVLYTTEKGLRLG